MFGSIPFWNWGVGHLPKRKLRSSCKNFQKPACKRLKPMFFLHVFHEQSHGCLFKKMPRWNTRNKQGPTCLSLDVPAGAGGGALLCTGLCFWVGIWLIQVDSWSSMGWKDDNELVFFFSTSSTTILPCVHSIEMIALNKHARQLRVCVCCLYFLYHSCCLCTLRIHVWYIYYYLP